MDRKHTKLSDERSILGHLEQKEQATVSVY